MIGSFEIVDLVILALLWFFMSAFSNLIWMRIVTLKYVGRAFMNWLDKLDKDPEGQKVLSKFFMMMFNWIGSESIKTGKKIKVKNESSGEIEEIEEIMTPIDLLGRRIGSIIFAKVRSGSGGTRAALGRILEEEAATAGGLSPTALRELNKGRIMPAIVELVGPNIQKRLNKGESITNNGGWDR